MDDNELEDYHIVVILRGLQKLGEIRRRAIKWAFCEMLKDECPILRRQLETWKNEICDQTWRAHVQQPIFSELEQEAERRGLLWDEGVTLDEKIDFSMRVPLERQIIGALKDCVNTHGPITLNKTSSAAKRVMGAIKTYNKEAK